MIHVTLSTMGGNYLNRITLNEDLVFRFHNVASGNYILTVEAEGHRTSEQVIDVSYYMSGEESFVALSLGPPLENYDPKLPPEGQTTVSADELAIPAKARLEIHRARRESEDGNPQKAIRHFRNALREHSELPEAYDGLAVEYLRLGRTEEAVSALERSIELKPREARTYRNLAQLYLSLEKPEKAVELLNHSLEIEGRNGRSVMLLGEAYLAKGQFGVALQYFQLASRWNPEDHSHLGLARCFLGLGRYEEALAEFQGFLRVEPEGPRAEGVREIVRRLEQELSG